MGVEKVECSWNVNWTNHLCNKAMKSGVCYAVQHFTELMKSTEKFIMFYYGFNLLDLFWKQYTNSFKNSDLIYRIKQRNGFILFSVRQEIKHFSFEPLVQIYKIKLIAR